MKQIPVKRAQSGYTILESIVALFIFSCITAAILKGIGSADKIRSRASVVMNVSRIAENQFEHIRQKASFSEEIQDCTWVMTSDGREYQIERRVLLPDSVVYGIAEKPSLLEIELRIKTGKDNPQTFRFRTLQGYSW
jgi:type II secretory pathway pseudopilin PulG